MKRLPYTDLELLEGLSIGDSQAIDSFYATYHKIWVKWISGRGGCEEDADDVFQDALMVLYEKSKNVEFCLTCKLSTYFFSIGKRLWYRKLERDGRFLLKETIEDEEPEQTGGDEDLEAFFQQEERFARLDQALVDLGEPCAALLRAFYMESKSMQEIADEFDYTNADNAKTQKYKCLNRLKRIYGRPATSNTKLKMNRQ